MSTRKSILDICKQFSYEPEIINYERLKRFDKFIVAGMGGSNQAPGILKIRDPFVDIAVHRDYGLPCLSEKELKGRLFIASSYSGNTEEPIDALEQAVKNNLSAVGVSTGGRLLDFVKKLKLPYIQLPDKEIQPRASLGFQLKAILKIMGREDLLAEISELSEAINPHEQEDKGRKLAEKLRGCIPVIYSSDKNTSVAYNWKIKFNETGKTPAFSNVFPELNHNEMTSFDIIRSDGSRTGSLKDRERLNESFYFIFLKDKTDHPKIQKRMEATKQLYNKKGLPVEIVEMADGPVFYKVFLSLILADWTALSLAEIYGLESEQVPIVEQFKKLI